MAKLNFDSLKEGLSFKSDVTLNKEFVILPAQVSVSKDLLKMLKFWNFSEFECDSGVSLEGLKTQNTTENKIQEKPAVKIQTETVQVSTEDFTENSPKQSDDIFTLIKDLIKQISIGISKTENSKLELVKKTYDLFMNYINSVYTHYATHSKISISELSEMVKELCNFIRINKRFILRVIPSVETRTKNFLVVHSMRSTVLAITIGLELKIPQSKLVELGMCCILHEIGMLKLPPQLYMTNKPLSPNEKKQIESHAEHGFRIVKSLDFPLSIQLGVLEHHEKENGTGYPRHLNGDKISVFAKIISVACSFEAITAPRQYKEERSTFDAMVEMLRDEKKQYNGIIMKALVYSLSLFPIGAYVYLKNGKHAIVTDANPNAPKYPVIQILEEKNADGTLKTVYADENEYKILRVMNKQEQKDILNSLNLNNTKEQPKKNEFDSVDLNEFN